MKITGVIFLAALMQVSASVYSQTKLLTLKVNNTPIESALKEIEKKSDFFFLYNNKQIDVIQKVDIDVSDKLIGDVLSEMLEKTGINYLIKDKQIVLYSGDLRSIVDALGESSVIQQQQKGVSGKVTDSAGQPLPGVTIVVKGTTYGTISNADGEYSLTDIPADAALVFSFVGLKTQEIVVGSQSTINVEMIEEVVGIEEVVAIGYGTMKKKDLTGAVGSIKSEKLARLAPTQTVEGIRGNVAGVQITQTNGKVGSGFSMIIRGKSSIDKSNTPLVVIDGVMGGDLNTLHPNDIQTMDILKDASAAAIYGSRGANGVIIITTKKGDKGKPVVSYDGYYGFTTPVNLPEYMNVEEQEALIATLPLFGKNPMVRTDEEADNLVNKKYFDWIDALLKTGDGIKSSHNISLSGGGENNTYYFSVSYLDEEGNIKPESYERANLKASIDTKVSEKLSAGFNSYFTYNVRDAGSVEALRAAWRLRKTINPYDPETGELTMVPSGIGGYGNPLLEVDDWFNESRIQNFLGTVYLEYKPWENLSFRSSFSAESNSQRRGEYRGLNTKYARERQSKTRVNFLPQRNASYNLDNIINYDWEKGYHKLKLTAANSIAYERYEGYYFQVRNFTGRYLWYAMENGTDMRTHNSDFWEWSLVSYMGRANYSYKNKYLLTLTSRWDGSSKLAEGHKWDFFPSFAFAWRANEEPFIKELNTFSNLKFRFSYGEVGNDDISPYSTQALVAKTGYNFSSNVSGLTPSSLANSDLGWEHSKEFNLGADMGFLKNRISVTAELYNRKTDGLIVNQGIPTSSGYNTIRGNFAKTRNKGIELSLNTTNFSTNDFTWTTDINFSKNKNEILALSAQEELKQMESSDNIYRSIYREYIVGEDVTSHYYYEFDGIFQTGEETSALANSMYGNSAEAGWVKVKDQNGDGQITPDDKKVLGTESPSWMGGMTNTFTYKNFDLSIFLYTVQDVFTFDNTWSMFGLTSSYKNKRLAFIDPWSPNNPSNTWDSPTASKDNIYTPVKWFHNTSWVRLQNVTLGYSLPNSVLSLLGVNKLRFYATANNPLLFSDYKGKGFDPEWTQQGTYGMGISTASYVLGVNVTF